MSEHRPGYLLSMRATRFAFAGVLLGMLLAALNQTIVATALPHIVEDLGGVAHYSWVFSAYMLASTVSVPIYGRLSDLYGRRPFFVAGILIFLAGALVGATADSMTQLIVARAIQGLGAFAVARIDGSYSNVVGLPACEVVAALQKTGLIERFPIARGAA